MKKLLSIALAAMLLTGLFSVAFAADYSSHIGNAPTFETLAEATVSGLEEVAKIYAPAAGVYAVNPVLANYPEGTTYIYRSADMFGSVRAACKLNTNVIVFAPTAFADKDAAKAYLEELGLIELIDSVTGSVVLVSPIGEKFGSADLASFKNLFTAMLAQKGTGMVDGTMVSYAEGEYFGGYGYEYIVGIGDGASFVNNYIATDDQLIGKIAGVMLSDGDIQDFHHVATAVPAYLMNCSEAVAAEYKAINAVDASSFSKGAVKYYNQAKPVMQVMMADAAQDLKACIAEAFGEMFCKVMRISATPYGAPYSLTPRSAIIDGMTDLGVQVTAHLDNRFEDIKTVAGAHLNFWYECLPQEVIDGTAKPGTIPLILALHGMGDDPLMFIDGNGYVRLAGEKRVAIVAPEHQDVFWVFENGVAQEGIELVVMPKLVEYMLETYPALDATRVYVTGYSMGGWATMKSIHGKPELFAACVPMSGMNFTPNEEQAAQFTKLDMPALITTSTNDMGMLFNPETGHIEANHQNLIKLFLGYNEMDNMSEFDFDTYPMNGFPSDSGMTVTLNGEYTNYRWFMHNDAGIPMVGLGVTEDLTHALYPEAAQIMWAFAKNYSRNLETLETIYNPNAK